MKGIFNFLLDVDNREERKVENYKTDKLVVDTCAVNDQPNPYKYETGICHKEYRNNKWIIVELYKTKKDSKIGHKKWVEVMTAKKLPDMLIDVSDIGITEMMDKLQGKDETWRVFKRLREVI